MEKESSKKKQKNLGKDKFKEDKEIKKTDFVREQKKK